MVAKQSYRFQATQLTIPATLEEWLDPTIGKVRWEASCGTKVMEFLRGIPNPAGANLPRIMKTRPPDGPPLNGNGSNYRLVENAEKLQEKYDDLCSLTWNLLVEGSTAHHLSSVTPLPNLFDS